MTDPVAHIQVDPTDSPSTPSWFGEVAVVAHALQRYGVLGAIQERVRFVRARMGKYELIDFAAMLIGYAVSGEPTLRAFCERVQPFASAFMALFGRADFPTPVLATWHIRSKNRTWPPRSLFSLGMELDGGTRGSCSSRCLGEEVSIRQEKQVFPCSMGCGKPEGCRARGFLSQESFPMPMTLWRTSTHS
jgi:hypothetical protein